MNAEAHSGYYPVTLGNAFRAAAARVPQKTALHFEGQSWTYEELATRIRQVANSIGHFQLKRGDRVALITGNCPEYFEIVIGLADAGIVVATLNPHLTAHELGMILADCQPRLVIATPGICDDVEALGGGYRTLRLGSEYQALIAGAGTADIAYADNDEADTFSISYTSGTTGRPKGVLLSHRSRVLTAVASAGVYRCFGQDDYFLGFSPLFHGAGFAFAVTNLLMGGTLELMPRFDAAVVLERLAHSGATGMFVVPTMMRRLLDAIEALPPGAFRHSLTGIISNATACPQIIKERATQIFGPGLFNESYGSTEGGVVTNIGPADLLRKPGSVGTPFALTEIEIRNSEGRAVGPGEVGQLFSRSPYLFNGYLNRPEDTASTLVDGWVSVGDLAIRDEEGHISIVGRAHDMIISGGVNVIPLEIEDVIAAVPGVVETAVVGIADPEWGETVQAFVVGNAAEDLITSICRAKLAPYKRPKKIHYVSELPRNAAGKVLKTALKQRLRDDLPVLAAGNG